MGGLLACRIQAQPFFLQLYFLVYFSLGRLMSDGMGCWISLSLRGLAGMLSHCSIFSPLLFSLSLSLQTANSPLPPHPVIAQSMSQGINGWKGRERLLWNSLSFLCPGWPLCVSLLCPIQVPSPWPFTGESMARSLSQPDGTAVSEGSRQRSRFLAGKREEVCAARGFSSSPGSTSLTASPALLTSPPSHNPRTISSE